MVIWLVDHNLCSVPLFWQIYTGPRFNPHVLPFWATTICILRRTSNIPVMSHPIFSLLQLHPSNGYSYFGKDKWCNGCCSLPRSYQEHEKMIGFRKRKDDLVTELEKHDILCYVTSHNFCLRNNWFCKFIFLVLHEIWNTISEKG